MLLIFLNAPQVKEWQGVHDFFFICVLRPVKFISLIFYLCFTVRQDYFTHFEPSQSLGGGKTGDPPEKTHDHQQAELG